MDSDAVRKQEGFIVDGTTARQEVEDRLGPAQSRYEAGRILVYRVHVDDQGRIGLRRDARLRCDAYVLVFDRRDVLERHSVVKNGCR